MKFYVLFEKHCLEKTKKKIVEESPGALFAPGLSFILEKMVSNFRIMQIKNIYFFAM